MRLTRRTALGIAIACGSLAALLSVVYLHSLQRQRAAPSPEKQQVDVVVPRVNIPSRTVITPDMLTMASLDEDKVPRGALTDATVAAGQVATQRLVAQQPILRTHITDRATAFGLAGIVPAGMRAVTVPVDPVTGVAGLLKPGDRVDVIATFEVGETLVAQTVLQDVELLALGTHTTDLPPAEAVAETKDEQTPSDDTAQARRERVEYPNATLGVTPEDAQRLLLAEQRGKLRLALRPVGEHDFVPVPAHDLAGVVGPEYSRLLMARQREEAEEKPAPEPAVQPTPPWPGWGPPTPEPAPKPAAKEPAKEPAKKEPEPKPPPEVEVIRRDQRETVVP